MKQKKGKKIVIRIDIKIIKTNLLKKEDLKNQIILQNQEIKKVKIINLKKYIYKL